MGRGGQCLQAGYEADGRAELAFNRRAYVEAKPIVIEKNVWIATAATILGGVTVGKNSVTGAGAVVTKDVPANSFVAGVPAKVIRSIEDSMTAE